VADGAGGDAQDVRRLGVVEPVGVDQEHHRLLIGGEGVDVDVGELGALYWPRYFQPDGIAVHGYGDVPAHPASHGCVRVSNAAIDWIWAENFMPIGSSVWVY
jgi:lipoprotein-anchoring transpeptidase ErfK/SrfK